MNKFIRPQDIKVEQKFTIKIQKMLEDEEAMMAMDHTGSCEFIIGPDQKFYRKLKAKLDEQTETDGMKAFMEASFDKKGQCKIYLNRTKIRTW